MMKCRSVGEGKRKGYRDYSSSSSAVCVLLLMMMLMIILSTSTCIMHTRLFNLLVVCRSSLCGSSDRSSSNCATRRQIISDIDGGRAVVVGEWDERRL